MCTYFLWKQNSEIVISQFIAVFICILVRSYEMLEEFLKTTTSFLKTTNFMTNSYTRFCITCRLLWMIQTVKVA
jgi:hypothetical protein